MNPSFKRMNYSSCVVLLWWLCCPSGEMNTVCFLIKTLLACVSVIHTLPGSTLMKHWHGGRFKGNVRQNAHTRKQGNTSQAEVTTTSFVLMLLWPLSFFPSFTNFSPSFSFSIFRYRRTTISYSLLLPVHHREHFDDSAHVFLFWYLKWAKRHEVVMWWKGNKTRK